MSLSGQQRKKLQSALIDAFPTTGDLERMLAFELEKNLREIAGEGSLQDIVFKLIQTADSQGWVEALIRVAYKENSGNPILQPIAQELLTGKTHLESMRILHNLPQPDYGKFIGREEELDKAMRILRPYPHSQHSLVTIDGVGGIGKSALALEISHLFLREANQLPPEDRFEVLVWTSAKQTVLRPGDGIITRQQVLRTLDDICEAVAVTLSIEDKIRSHPRDKVGLIRRHLVQQRTLLVVDNLETVDDEAVIEFLQELPAPTKAIITTRHRIDVAYPVRLVGMKWKESKTLIEQECLKKEAELTEEQKKKLHDRTGGVPLAIVWSIAEVGFGHSIDTMLVKLGNPKGDIARFCFESVIEKIRNTDAYKLLLSLALCRDTGSREELGYVAEFGDDLISRDEGLVELEKLSLVNKNADKFSILPLTREYVEHELVLNSNFACESVYRLIDYHLKRNIPYIASTYLVNHKSKLSKDNLEKFLDEVVEQFWSETSAYMNDQDMYYSDPYSLGSYVDGICFQCISTMESIGGNQGIEKLRNAWDQIWRCDQFISYCSVYQNSSPIQDCINSLGRLGEYEFLIEILATKKYRAYANEILQVIEKSGKKDLVQLSKNILNTESDEKNEVYNVAEDLSSDHNVDYTKLRNFLKAGQWKEADYETYLVMLKVVYRTEGEWIRNEELLYFPSTDLRTIDCLWVKYSNGRFGFSVQKKIYLGVGGRSDGKYDEEVWNKFGDHVGWRKAQSIDRNWIDYSEVTFATTAPKGHLPIYYWNVRLNKGLGWEGDMSAWMGGVVSCLVSKLAKIGL